MTGVRVSAEGAGLGRVVSMSNSALAFKCRKRQRLSGWVFLSSKEGV